MDDDVSLNPRPRSVEGSTTSPLSPMQGAGGESGVNIDIRSSHSEHAEEHTTTPNDASTQNPTQNESVREPNEVGEDEVQLKRKRQKTSKVWEDFVEVTLPDGKKKPSAFTVRRGWLWLVQVLQQHLKDTN